MTTYARIPELRLEAVRLRLISETRSCNVISSWRAMLCKTSQITGSRRTVVRRPSTTTLCITSEDRTRSGSLRERRRSIDRARTGVGLINKPEFFVYTYAILPPFLVTLEKIHRNEMDSH